MIEPFFGSGPQLWTGIPFPSHAWPQAPIQTANRATSPAEAFAYQAFGLPGVVPALAGPDVPNGPPARALVTAAALRRGQPMGPTNDSEVEEFLYDALDMLLGANDVDVRYEGGRIALTGTVAHKRIKRDVGEIAWATPGVSDVQNNVTIAGRRRSRPPIREAEPQPSPSRKQRPTSEGLL